MIMSELIRLIQTRIADKGAEYVPVIGWLSDPLSFMYGFPNNYKEISE